MVHLDVSKRDRRLLVEEKTVLAICVSYPCDSFEGKCGMPNMKDCFSTVPTDKTTAV